MSQMGSCYSFGIIYKSGIIGIIYKSQFKLPLHFENIDLIDNRLLAKK